MPRPEELSSSNLKGVHSSEKLRKRSRIASRGSSQQVQMQIQLMLTRQSNKHNNVSHKYSKQNMRLKKSLLKFENQCSTDSSQDHSRIQYKLQSKQFFEDSLLHSDHLQPSQEVEKGHKGVSDSELRTEHLTAMTESSNNLSKSKNKRERRCEYSLQNIRQKVKQNSSACLNEYINCRSSYRPSFNTDKTESNILTQRRPSKMSRHGRLSKQLHELKFLLQHENLIESSECRVGSIQKRQERHGSQFLDIFGPSQTESQYSLSEELKENSDANQQKAEVKTCRKGNGAYNSNEEQICLIHQIKQILIQRNRQKRQV